MQVTVAVLHAGPAQHIALRRWFQHLAANAEQGAAAAGDREQFLKWSKIKYSTLGVNMMEQDVASLFAIAMDLSVYVISVPTGGDHAQITVYGEKGGSV